MKRTLSALALLLAGALAHAQGVSDSQIVLGQSAALTGPAQELGKDMQLGASLYFQHVNQTGGVNGRKIELKTLDDGYEPPRAAANTKQLINEDKVFALFGYVGTPTSQAALPIFTDAKVPWHDVAHRFDAHSGSLEPALREFVRERLQAARR